MAYSDFTFEDLKIKFGINQYKKILFNNIEEVPSSDLLNTQIAQAHEMPLVSEKARSEFLIAPILLNIRFRNKENIELFSGSNLDADKETGLNGEVDFIFANAPHYESLTAPLVAVIEAKRNDIESSLPQCAAQMYGARTYNIKKGRDSDIIYGCVTTGTEWRFMMLKNSTLFIDQDRYHETDIALLLGVFQYIINVQLSYT